MSGERSRTKVSPVQGKQPMSRLTVGMYTLGVVRWRSASSMTKSARISEQTARMRVPDCQWIHVWAVPICAVVSTSPTRPCDDHKAESRGGSTRSIGCCLRTVDFPDAAKAKEGGARAVVEQAVVQGLSTVAGTGRRTANSPEVQRREAPWGRRVRRDANSRSHPTMATILPPLTRLVRGPGTITRRAR
jgi:hypothetical protein